jgi:hypothetical protein
MADTFGEAGPSEPAPSSWLRAIDNVYALFEEEEQRAKFPKLASQVEEATRLCEEVIEEFGYVSSTSTHTSVELTRDLSQHSTYRFELQRR